MNGTSKTVLKCPSCGDRFDGHMAIGKAAEEKMRAPQPGSLIVCLNCGELCLMSFRATRGGRPEADGTARRLTEREAMDLSPEMVRLLATCEEARQATMRNRGRNVFGRERSR